ncbi:hypothetical protein LT493_17845 [Streptomyces tricolor]|nr:hypothetical protein [Streptomyces tricolor]
MVLHHDRRLGQDGSPLEVLLPGPRHPGPGAGGGPGAGPTSCSAPLRARIARTERPLTPRRAPSADPRAALLAH